MKTRTIVTVIATALFSVSFVPVSSAQDSNGNVPEGIEIITIIAKRPAPTVASTCVNAVTARTDAGVERHNGHSNFNDEVLKSGLSNISTRRAIKHCIEQAATTLEAQI